jgi:hypothetical protein
MSLPGRKHALQRKTRIEVVSKLGGQNRERKATAGANAKTNLSLQRAKTRLPPG